jgi:hypothetical protein
MNSNFTGSWTGSGGAWSKKRDLDRAIADNSEAIRAHSRPSNAKLLPSGMKKGN